MGVYAVIALISASFAVLTMTLSLIDRIYIQGKRETQITLNIKMLHDQILELKKIVEKHDRELTDIQLKCSRRVAETSTTEQMRTIINQELANLPDMIIAEMMKRGYLK